MAELPPLDAATVAWRLGATLFFVLLNGFFVAAEFSLVKVRATRLRAMTDQGSGRARRAGQLVERLDLYLSACQFGITVASLILGWLAEPAVAQLLLAGAAKLGWSVSDGPWLHAVALAIALAVVTALHMTLGEQAPKMWAIQRAENVSLKIAYPLWLFTVVFRPLIALINQLSNALLRLFGIAPHPDHEGPLDAEELRSIVAASARAGHITSRQRKFTENILGLISLQVRHILVPRVDVVFLSLGQSPEENLGKIRSSKHSRLPLCAQDLDHVVGIVHAKDVLAALADGEVPDLRRLARSAVFVPDTQPLGRMIFELQRLQRHCAVVLDDHGTAIGMAFLEDALEEIVGPIRDEFDEEQPAVERMADGSLEIPGHLPLPEAVALLGIDAGTDEDDTIGGHIVSLLGRLPVEGDEVIVGGYQVRVMAVARNRVGRLRFQPRVAEEEPEAN